MPRIPDFAAVQADTRVLAPTRADTSVLSPGAAAIPGQQLQQAGSALAGAGDVALKIATDMQETVNQTRAADALNQLQQQRIKLATDPDGYLAQTGIAALKRDSGMSLPDEYGQKLKQFGTQLSENLDNDAQRRVFNMRAGDVQTAFQGDVASHAFKEFKTYGLSVQDGAYRLAADEAKRNWSDPVRFDTAMAGVKVAIIEAGKLTGESGPATVAKLLKAQSEVHIGAIDSALSEGNVTFANAHLNAYRSQMTADDLIKANTAVNSKLNVQVAQSATALTTQHFSTQLQPNFMDRLTGVVLGLESGGKDTGADGKPLTSPKGAMFSMQVMPDTAKNPGFSIRPAQDASAAEYNRVGREYLGALVQKYGNPAQALAAYNAGPGAMDDAMKKADKAGQPQTWLAYLPKETQAYVQNGVAKINAGGGTAPMPTEMEFVSHAVGLLGPGAPAEQVQIVRQNAEHQYGIITKSINQQGDQAVSQAQQALIQNGGNWAAVPDNLKQQVYSLAPGKADDLLKFANRMAATDHKSDPAAYMNLATYPEEMAKMTDAQFMQLRTSLSETDFKHFAQERADILNGKKTDSAEAINSTALNQVLGNRLTSLGINATPKPTDKAGREQVGTIQKFARDSVFEQQRQLGRKLTAAEIDEHVDKLFAKNLDFQRTFLGISFGTSNQNMMSMKVGDIPRGTADTLRASFAKAGIKNPTDDQVLRAYWTMKGRNAQ